MDSKTNNNEGDNNDDVHMDHEIMMNDYIELVYANRHDDAYIHTSYHTHNGVRDDDLENGSLYSATKMKLYEGACLSQVIDNPTFDEFQN